MEGGALQFLTHRGTWCGYEVPGTILLRNVKTAMQRKRSKDMSVHASTCTSYDLAHERQLCGSCGADMTCCVPTSRHKNE